MTSTPSKHQRGWAWGVLTLLALGVAADYVAEPEASQSFVAGVLLLGVVGVVLAALGRVFDRQEHLTPARELTSAVVVVAALLMIATGFATTLGLTESPSGALETVLGSLGSAIMFVGVWLFAFRYPRARERASQALALAREGELAELRSRLHPHFLGNALNSVAGLVTRDPERARELLADLGDLLRELSSTTAAERPLGDELAWIRRYAAVLEARHAGDVVFRWSVDDAVVHVNIPSFVLQPLVENAVVHGPIGDAERPSVIELVARRSGDAALIELRNGLREGAAAPSAGVGLDFVRRRLALARPPATLEVERSAHTYVCRVRLPA